MKVLLVLMLSTGTGLSFDTIPVSSVDECKSTAKSVVGYMVGEGHAIGWGKSSSMICIDAKTGKELVKRTYLDKKGNPK